MANSTAMATSFKVELLTGTHSFAASGGDSMKFSMYTSSATLGAGTTAYTTTNEISGTGYTAGGAGLTNINPSSSGTTALTDFNDVSFTSASFTANAGLIYNSTDTNKAVSSHAFGGDVTVTSGTLTIVFPAADASNAIIRLT